jgi:hypothetical protein
MFGEIGPSSFHQHLRKRADAQDRSHQVAVNSTGNERNGTKETNAALRQSVQRGPSFGSAQWQQQIVKRLGLESADRPVGGPRKLAQSPVAGSPWQSAAGIKSSHFINLGPAQFSSPSPSPFSEGCA